MISRSIVCAALVALTAGARAQTQTTTLLAAARAADVVVVATVIAATDPSPEWHRLQFRSEQVLEGQVGPYFSLLEPAGRCCGRCLFTLSVGETRLLFLRRVGPALHVLGGARGVLPATSALTAHTATLLATTGDGAVARLLADNLANPEPRIADDAAQALAALPALSLPAAERGLVIEALALSVAQGRTRSASLADVAARVADADVLDALLPIYLDAERTDQAELLQRVLLQSPAGLVAERLPLFVGRDRRRDLRAARLLRMMPGPAAHGAMLGLLRRQNHPQVELHLCEGLLAAGVKRAELAPLVPEAVLELAQQRRSRPQPLRNIDPRR